MRQLSTSAQQAIADIAQRHGFSVEATRVMLDAVVRGNGSMAQFSHPEFGGSGQWMRGGMTMVGRMFDNELKGWVAALCQDLSNLVASAPEPSAWGGPEPAPPGNLRGSGFAPSGLGDLFMPGSGDIDTGWPAELGVPNASGSQNGARYAYFAGPRRLVVEIGGTRTVYDTGEHRIGGVSQHQPGRGGLSFTSQRGLVDVDSLPVVPEPGSAAAPMAGTAPLSPPAAPASDAQAVFNAIEQLAALKQKGILSDEEFASKKAELLRRV